jgi:DNA-binding MarR family transcriptional regulator
MRMNFDAPRRARSHRFAYLLTAAQKRMQQWISAQGEGATAARSGVLMVIKDLPEGTALAEVSRALDLSPSAVSGLIDRMEAANLLRRGADPEDGRAFRLHLTDQGRTARIASIARARDLNARLAADFTDEELDVVARWLASFNTKFDQET